MKLFKEVQGEDCRFQVYDMDAMDSYISGVEPIEITEEDLAKFLIDWGLTFMPDDWVGENKDYEVAIELAKDIIDKLKGE